MSLEELPDELRPHFAHDWEREEWERDAAKRAERRKARLSEPPKANTAPAAFERMAKRLDARMRTTACEGERAHVDRCIPSVFAACHERESKACPKLVIRHESDVKPSIDIAEVWQGWGIPADMALRLKAKGFVTSEAIWAADEWHGSKPRPRVLVLLGGTGLGKSFAAAYILTRQGGRFVTAHEIQGKRRDAEYLRQFGYSSLLAIDDLGAETMDGFGEFQNALDRVFCSRVDAGRETVITTNLSADDLRQRYGERVYDRIRGFGLVVGVAGDSLRGRT